MSGKFIVKPREPDYSKMHPDVAVKMCLRKRAYDTYAGAVKEAEFLAGQYGHPQTAYSCPICFKYHLTSRPPDKKPAKKKKENAEVSTKMCFGKNRYPNFDTSEQYAKKYMTERPETKLRSYFCPICSGFHITSKPEPSRDEAV